MRFSKPNISVNINVRDRIDLIFASGWVSIGKYMEELEGYFRKQCGVKHAIACGSCTQGLLIAMQAAGWKGRKVAVPAFTWPSTIYAIETSGNTPVYCDITQDSWQIDLKTATTSYDKVVPVDTFGNECPTYAGSIYDAAHGYGLGALGKRGDAEVVSFSHTKPVTACEGGMILTNSDGIAERATELRKLTSRMGEVNALVALTSIQQYDDNIAAKKSVIRKYMSELKFDKTTQLFANDMNLSVFAILLENHQMREDVVGAFKEDGIETKVYYEPIVSGLPVTDDIYSRIIALPTYYGVDCDRVIRVANEAVK